MRATGFLRFERADGVMGCGASKALEANPYTEYAASGSPRWAPNQDESSPQAAVAEMEEEMRARNAGRAAGMAAEMRRMGVPAETKRTPWTPCRICRQICSDPL